MAITYENIFNILGMEFKAINMFMNWKCLEDIRKKLNWILTVKKDLDK